MHHFPHLPSGHDNIDLALQLIAQSPVVTAIFKIEEATSRSQDPEELVELSERHVETFCRS